MIFAGKKYVFGPKRAVCAFSSFEFLIRFQGDFVRFLREKKNVFGVPNVMFVHFPPSNFLFVFKVISFDF